MDNVREQIEFDVLFVGGGPASLAGAIHLMKLAKTRGIDPQRAYPRLHGSGLSH
jgi:ribulose 1,5-bisphosphate synthetase/thiazole synthase